MKNETYELNKSLITSAMANIEAWEQWADAVPQGAAKALNLSLIRLTKGLVKAWRKFLADTGQKHKQSASSQPTAASLANHRNKRSSKWANME